MINKITEQDMERLLTSKGYNIFVDLDDGKHVDSTLVIDYAIDEGYEPRENSKGIHEFFK